jgi:DNA repair protein RecN (Recombination protein N)
VLRELRIRDVAIIEDIEVSFGAGLNVLSGETGAGKSIILDALGLVLGNRASGEMVRTGRPGAEVQALFDRSVEVDRLLSSLEVHMNEEDEGLLIRRTVSAAGRSRAWICGTGVTLAALRELATLLLDYGSQQEHRVLLEETQHLAILDRFSGLSERCRALTEQVTGLRLLVERRSALQEQSEESLVRADFLRFQLRELGSLAPLEGEFSELKTEVSRLRNAADIGAKAHEVVDTLYSSDASAVDQLAASLTGLEFLAQLDGSLAEPLAALRSALIVLEDTGHELGSYARSVREDPERLQEVEDRISELGHLSRKHRCTAAELPGLQRRIEEELGGLEHLSDNLVELDHEIEERGADLLLEAAELSVQRGRGAARLSEQMGAELGSLGMNRARLDVSIEDVPKGAGLVEVARGDSLVMVSSTGTDKVRFEFSANIGEELRPLAKVASGGELARILLALRRALAGSGAVQVCVFDEVDAGIGGVTAEIVAAKLAGIAETSQVLCITHLPQIAAAAEHHFRVRKAVDGGRTRTCIAVLDEGRQVAELMRMVAGTDRSEAAEAFARELLDRARTSRAGSMPATLSG